MMALKAQQARMRDQRTADERERFTSNILPPYLRTTKSMEQLLACLYLTGQIHRDLSSLCGSGRRLE